jgi:1A family penicillin-binding protein
MWDPYAPPPKPFYRRAWFLTLTGCFVLAALALAVLWWRLKSEYGARAAGFDFSRLEEMESASTIYDRHNKVFGRMFLENRDAVPLSDIPYEMVQAVIAAEDNRFFQHHGVDYYGMSRALVKNWRAGRIRQGASTLTQQLVRNTFELRERSYDRKLLEAFLAMEVEKRLNSKQKIIELYLNRVYFGAGFYGVEAAARGYFGKPARNLNLSECATLAGLLKNPNKLSPWTNRQACIDARNFVLGRMLDEKMVTQDEYQRQMASNLAVKNRRVPRVNSYAMDLIRQQVIAKVGSDSAKSDGYRIYTTIDAALQKQAEESLRAKLRGIEGREGFEHQKLSQYEAILRARKKDDDDSALPAPEYLQGAVVVLENSSGAILALVGGRDFNHSQYNRAMSAARPAGTAFKPFVFAAAFEKGLFPGMLLQDTLMDNRQVMIGGTTGILGEWGPERVDNRYEGAITARAALVKSKNAATVRLGMATGVENVIALARKAGLERVMGRNGGEEIMNLRRFPATYLGSSEVTLMDLTLAYTTFPNGGWRPTEPFIITRIEDKTGRTAFRSTPGKERVMKATTAAEIHSCLAEVLETGTGDKAFSQYGLRKFPVAGKTGTAYNFTDAWFVGYSSAVTCGVWAGLDKPEPIYRGAFSNEIALPVWVEVMNASFGEYKPRDLPQPRGLKKYEICLKSGLLATPQCSETTQDKNTGDTVTRRTTYFEMATPEQAPRETCNIHGESAGLLTSGQGPLQQPAIAPPTPSQYPRATLAVDVTNVAPVMMKGPTIIGEDPYHAVRPSTVLAATKVEDSAADMEANSSSSPMPNVAAPVVPPPPAPLSGSDIDSAARPESAEVRRAEPVRTLDQPAVDSPIKIEPPAPLEF